MKKARISIQLKLTLLIISISYSVTALSIFAGYSWGFNLLRDTITGNYHSITEGMIYSFNQILDEQVNEVKTMVDNHPLWEDNIMENNMKYAGIPEADIEKMLLNLDKRWVEAPDNDALLKPYLESRVAQSLTTLVKGSNTISEIFLTDKKGGLVAASNRISDYYQADETWWQEAFNQGKGSLFIGDVEFDQSSQILAIPMAAAVKDGQGEITGVCKVVINLSHFFSPLQEFKIGKTGHAFLIDDKGRLVFHQGLVSLAPDAVYAAIFHELSSGNKNFMLVKEPDNHKGTVFISGKEVTYPLLLERKINWMLCISQDKNEAFAPLDVLKRQLALLTFLVFTSYLMLGILVGRMFVRPIYKLREATQHIYRGDLDYKVEIEASDEIGDLALAFNLMAGRLKGSFEELKTAKDKLEEYSRLLEGQVTEKTKDLTIKIKEIEEQREATLNILADIEVAHRELAEANKRLKESEAQLIQSGKMAAVGQLASGVAHEINNPLTGVLNNVQLIKMELEQKKDYNPIEFKELLDIIEESALRCKNITKALLDFSRASKGIIQKVDLNELIGKIMVLTEHELELENILIQKELELNLPLILGDTQLLEQTIFNFISNAKWAIQKKSGSSGGLISIETLYDVDKNEVNLSITDTGIGITPENKNRLFEPFFTTKEVGEGTGLGLSLIYNIVKQHKGTIEVESKIDKGTTFKVCLPVIAENGG